MTIITESDYCLCNFISFMNDECYGSTTRIGLVFREEWLNGRFHFFRLLMVEKT